MAGRDPGNERKVVPHPLAPSPRQARGKLGENDVRRSAKYDAGNEGRRREAEPGITATDTKSTKTEGNGDI
jgi:hypothetical protein